MTGSSIAGTVFHPASHRMEESLLPVFQEFFHWSFGGIPGASCLDARSDHFEIKFSPRLDRKPFDFRQEVIAACKRLDDQRDGKTIALCYSGGMDSEIIARTLAKLGIPFELYFLDIWGLNRSRFEEDSASLLSELKKKAQIVHLSKEFLYRELISRSFLATGCELPTYLCLTYLFERIPADQYIVVGDGDLDRSAKLYGEIAKEHSVPSGGIHLPFSSSRVAYLLWARKHRRAGEFYFYGSTPELLAAAFLSPDFRYSYPHASPRKLAERAFPEVTPRPKTTNWDTAAAGLENRWVRARVKRIVRDMGDMYFWRPGIGAIADLGGIFHD